MQKSKQNMKAMRAKGPVAAAARKPVAVSRGIRTSAPKITSGRRGSVRVSHREYIADVVLRNGSFQTEALPCNPGMTNLFPWLATMANSFELYRFDHLEFSYVPRCAVTTAGMVYLAYDYDALDAAPETKGALLSYEGAVSEPVWNEFSLVLPGSKLNRALPERYTRAGVHTDIDLKTYDTGSLILGTSGSALEDLVVGELYVQYVVDLMAPQVRGGTAPMITADSFTEPSVAVIPATYSSTVGTPVVATGEEGRSVLTFVRTWSGMVRVAAQFASDLSTSIQPVRLEPSQQVLATDDSGRFSKILDSPPSGVTGTSHVMEFLVNAVNGDRIGLQFADAVTPVMVALHFLGWSPLSLQLSPVRRWGATVMVDSEGEEESEAPQGAVAAKAVVHTQPRDCKRSCSASPKRH